MHEINPSLEPRIGGAVDLDPDDTDHLVSVLKAAVSGLPVVGPFLCELVLSNLPNQRADRMATLLRQLAVKLAQLDARVVEGAARSAEFIDLLEEGAQQAIRSSNKRIEQIAAVIKNGITSEAHSAADQLFLLKLLRELDDPALLMLTDFGHAIVPGEARRDFYEQHVQVLQRPSPTLGGGAEKVEKAAFYDGRRNVLQRLGFLKEEFDPKKVDQKKGLPKVKAHTITNLGRLLLHACDIEFRDPMRN